MKRILYINNFEAPYRVPFYNLIAEKFDLTVAFSDATSDQSERNQKWFYNGDRKYKVIQLNCKKVFGKRLGFEVLKYMKDYDLIFMDMYSNPTNLLANLYLKFTRKKKLVLSIDGMLKHPNESWFIRAFKRWILKTPQYILSPSEYVDECLEQYNVPQKKLFRYNFTSILKEDILDCLPTMEEKKALREKLNIKGDKVVVSVGQFIHRKGFDVLLKAFSNCPKTYSLNIIGAEPTQEYINLKNEYELDNVQFIGFKSKEELKEYYSVADLFVLPTREDVWGLVINEAMAQGLPVITTDRCVSGLALVDNGENGYIVPVEDYEQLADRINRILQSEEVCKRMSENSLKTIASYTIEHMAEQHVEVFNKVLAEERKS